MHCLSFNMRMGPNFSRVWVCRTNEPAVAIEVALVPDRARVRERDKAMALQPSEQCTKPASMTHILPPSRMAESHPTQTMPFERAI